MSTSGWEASTSPTSAPAPVTRLMTPAGMPASWAISSRSNAASGATLLGLRTVVQPCSMAGASLATSW